MFFATTISIFDDVNIVSAIHHATLKLSIPAVFDISAGEKMLAVYSENIQLVLLETGCGDRFEDIVQAVTVGSECIGNGKQ